MKAKTIDRLVALAFGQKSEGKFNGKLALPEGPLPGLAQLMSMARKNYEGQTSKLSYKKVKDQMITAAKELRRTSHIYQ